MWWWPAVNVYFMYTAIVPVSLPSVPLFPSLSLPFSLPSLPFSSYPLPVSPLPMPSPFKLIMIARPLFRWFSMKILCPTAGTKCPPAIGSERAGEMI